jgi:NitT/TauT family transport system substrate-binding protein
MMKRRLFLASAAAVGTVRRDAQAQTATAATLRVSVQPVEGGLGPYYALESGLFSKAGLDVQIVATANGAASSTAVVAGVLDIGQSSPPAVVSAALHGVPLRLFAANILWSSAAPIGGMIVAKDSPIRSARDFEGKTIGVAALDSGTHIIAAAWLVKNGADLSKVSFIEVPFSAMLAAIGAGRVAGALELSPFMPGPNDDTRVLALGWDALGDRYMSTGYIATEAWLKANRALAHRFASVMYETAHWANDPANRARTGEIVQKYTKLSDAVLQRLVRSTFADRFSPSMVEPYLDWEYRLKFTPRRVRVDEVAFAV